MEIGVETIDATPDGAATPAVTTRGGGWKGSQASLDALAAARARKKASKVEPADPGPVVIEEGMPEQLADMRHVYTRPERADGTTGQRACRSWMKDNISSFMATKSKLEEAFLEYKRDQTVPALPPEEAVDEPLEKLIAMVEEDLRTKPWEKEEQ